MRDTHEWYRTMYDRNRTHRSSVLIIGNANVTTIIYVQQPTNNHKIAIVGSKHLHHKRNKPPTQRIPTLGSTHYTRHRLQHPPIVHNHTITTIGITITRLSTTTIIHTMKHPTTPFCISVHGVEVSKAKASRSSKKIKTTKRNDEWGG